MIESRIRVLLIEDNPADARLLQESMADATGAAIVIVIAGSLREGFTRIDDGGIDAILLDLNLPDSRGLDSFLQVRSRVPRLPVIVMTGFNDEILAARTMREGAQDYLVKGAHDGHLIARSIRYSIERKRIEEQLRESEDRYRALFENSLDAIQLEREDGTVIAANPPACLLLGRSEEEICRTGTGLNENRADPGFAIFLEERRRTGKTFGETTVTRKDGTQVPVEVSSTTFHDRDGIECTAVSFRDISERKRSIDALAASEAKYRSLVEQLPDVIYVARDDNPGALIYISPQIEPLLGYAPEELISDPTLWAQCLHPEDKDRILSDRGSFTGEEEVRHQYRMFSRQGAEMWFHDKARIIRDTDGKPLFIQGILTDITRLKEIERIALLQEKMASLGHMAAGMAHEIRNPLSGVNIYLGTAGRFIEDSEGIDDDSKEKLLNIIASALAASAKIEDVMRRVMNFARPGGVLLRRTRIDQAIREAVEFSLLGFRQNRVRIEVSVPGTLPECYADLRIIEQVVLNLIVNAAQAIEGQNKPGIVSVVAVSEGDHVVIRVSDSGPGVPDHLKQKIFEPFVTTKPTGMGIGLSFCNRVIAEHGGYIEVGDSRLGGAEFITHIPVDGRRRATGS